MTVEHLCHHSQTACDPDIHNAAGQHPAGSNLGPITVQGLDSSGGGVVGATVTLTISSGTIPGTFSATTDASGNAVFSTLSVNARHLHAQGHVAVDNRPIKHVHNHLGGGLEPVLLHAAGQRQLRRDMRTVTLRPSIGTATASPASA